MTRQFFTFLGTFLAGALIALGARTAMHRPIVDHTGHPAAGGDYAPLVTNTPPDPHAGHAAAKPAAADPHAAHKAAVAGATAAAVSSDQPVNTHCAICGMAVDPKLPTMEYQGKKIGFGCKMCPPKFKAEPDKYGPYYLRNEIIKR